MVLVFPDSGRAARAPMTSSDSKHPMWAAAAAADGKGPATMPSRISLSKLAIKDSSCSNALG
eukprot:6407822-Amphidinium_carterae.1